MAMSQDAREDVQIWQFLNKLLPKKAVKGIKMLGNNETSLTLTRNPKSQNQIKHIDVMHYHVKRLVEDEELTIDQIESFKMLTDGLTKTFPTTLFKMH